MNNDTSEKDQHYPLAPDLTIHRIINGMWQVAGGHGYIDHEIGNRGDDEISRSWIHKLGSCRYLWPSGGFYWTVPN